MACSSAHFDPRGPFLRRSIKTIRYHWLRTQWENQAIRYLFFGGLTVLVNLLCFRLLTGPAGFSVDAGNGLSILVALLFAYGTNTRFVFRSKCRGLPERCREFLRFLSARLFTMALEFVGVHLLVELLGWNELLSKTGMQGIVIVLNYLFSKRLVYPDP